MSIESPGLDFSTSYRYAPLPDRIITLFREWEKEGKLGFMKLPEDTELLSETLRLADTAREYADRMIVCGIGGSSLGLRALLSAFTGSFDNKDKVVVADSPDSALISELTACMD
ncbi:MAG: hypothetical protein ABFR50_09475, partial [Candidatus Fermentibacteria bacterium]